MVTLALLIALTGCGTRTVVEFIYPECEFPVIPALHETAWDDLLVGVDKLDDAEWARFDRALEQLEANEARLVDTILEYDAVLREVCR